MNSGEKKEGWVAVQGELTLNDIIRCTGIDRSILSRLLRLGLLEPLESDSEPVFHQHTVVRINKMMRLRHELGVGYSSMALVMDLLDKIDRLEKELELHRYLPFDLE